MPIPKLFQKVSPRTIGVAFLIPAGIFVGISSSNMGSSDHPDSDIISRLDSETMKTTTGEEWKRSGLIVK
jgi:hypothetical protein